MYKKSYFVQIESTFINNPKYTTIEKLVYLSLCTYAGQKRNCFPGQEGIAKNLGVTRMTINKTIKSLQEKNGIYIINQYTKTGRRTSNTYILADIDPISGEFVPESLDIYKKLYREPIIVDSI